MIPGLEMTLSSEISEYIDNPECKTYYCLQADAEI